MFYVYCINYLKRWNIQNNFSVFKNNRDNYKEYFKNFHNKAIINIEKYIKFSETGERNYSINIKSNRKVIVLLFLKILTVIKLPIILKRFW